MENKEIIAALIAAQSKMGVADQSGDNPRFRNKYAKLEDIIILAAPVLNENGLAITQYAYTDEFDKTYMVTKLLHTSGQSIECKLLMHFKDPTNMQEFGTSSTYIRRYTYAAMCGIISGEKDDDGNESADKANKSPETKKQESSEPLASESHLKQLSKIFDRYDFLDRLDLKNKYFEIFKITAWNQLKQSECERILKEMESE